MSRTENSGGQRGELQSCEYSLASPPNPVCICLNLLLSISQIQTPCKSVGRQQLGSVPVVLCYHGGDSQGIPCSHHSSLQERLVCTHTKNACHFFIVCRRFFASDVLSSAVCLPGFFPSGFKSKPRLPLCQRSPLTEAAVWDVR